MEDDEGDRLLIAEALEASGRATRLHTVDDGEEALAFLPKTGPHGDASTPDRVLLALNLPRRDGRQVPAELKSDPARHTIPVVVLTTSSDDHDVLSSYDLHANACITNHSTQGRPPTR